MTEADHTYDVPGLMNRVPPFTGTHYWVMPMMYAVDPVAMYHAPDDEKYKLAPSNLVAVQAIRCYHCGQLYKVTLPWLCEGDDHRDLSGM